MIAAQAPFRPDMPCLGAESGMLALKQVVLFLAPIRINIRCVICTRRTIHGRDRTIAMNDRQATMERTRDEVNTAGTGMLAGSQAGMAAGGTVGAAAGGITGWGVGMAGGAFIGLVAGMFLGLAIANSRHGD
jgi:hypothetical protein